MRNCLIYKQRSSLVIVYKCVVLIYFQSNVAFQLIILVITHIISVYLVKHELFYQRMKNFVLCICVKKTKNKT